jgi:hypothetical protein
MCVCWDKHGRYLSLYNESFSMLSIQLILDISNQWSIRTSFISDDENDRKEAGFAQWNQCRLFENMISLLCCSHSFTLHILFTKPSQAVLEEKHPFKTTWFSHQRILSEELEVSACTHTPNSMNMGRNGEVNETEISFHTSPTERSAVKQACQTIIKSFCCRHSS